jgi:hypothetical protein
VRAHPNTSMSAPTLSHSPAPPQRYNYAYFASQIFQVQGE